MEGDCIVERKGRGVEGEEGGGVGEGREKGGRREGEGREEGGRKEGG